MGIKKFACTMAATSVVAAALPIVAGVGLVHGAAAGGCTVTWGGSVGVGVGTNPPAVNAGAQVNSCSYQYTGGLLTLTSSGSAEVNGFVYAAPCGGCPVPPPARCGWVTLTMLAPGTGTVADDGAGICSMVADLASAIRSF